MVLQQVQGPVHESRRPLLDDIIMACLLWVKPARRLLVQIVTSLTCLIPADYLSLASLLLSILSKSAARALLHLLAQLLFKLARLVELRPLLALDVVLEDAEDLDFAEGRVRVVKLGEEVRLLIRGQAFWSSSLVRCVGLWTHIVGSIGRLLLHG